MTSESTAKEQSTFIDPVCGITVVPEKAGSFEHDGTTYYFCGVGCLNKFKADPSLITKAPSSWQQKLYKKK